MKVSNKKRVGIVVSNKSKKTAVISIQSRTKHSKYIKILSKTRRYMAHDEYELSKVGDIVLIENIAPISRHKAWLIKKILNLFENN